LQIILGGRRLAAREAFAWGLVDDVAQGEEDDPPAFLAAPVKRAAPCLPPFLLDGEFLMVEPPRGLPRHTWRQWLVESTALGRWVIFRGTERLLRRRLPDDMPAPWEALRAVRTGIN